MAPDSRSKRSSDWVATFRNQVRARTAKGWGVLEERNAQIRLQVRSGPGLGSVVLPYQWRLEDTPDALKRIEHIYAQVCDGQTLKGAAGIVDHASSRTTINWRKAMARFEVEKRERGTVIKDITWEQRYLPILTRAVELLESRRAPQCAEDLIDAVLAKWTPGSRARQIAAQNLAQFLNYCTQRLKYPNCWMPPSKLSYHVGQRPHGTRRKRDGYPLSDAQILRLLEHLPAGEHVAPWRFGLQLMATYGLRPEELRYLAIRPNGQLWCEYQKKGGGGQTEPRQLHPLPVRDLDGTAMEWHLQQRLQVGEPLPPLGQPGKGGEALITFLRRLSMWQTLQAEVAATGMTLVPYSFRHRYSREAHRLGIPSKDIADAMGHSLECHLRAYANFTSSQTAEAFAKATAKLEAQLAAV